MSEAIGANAAEDFAEEDQASDQLEPEPEEAPEEKTPEEEVPAAEASSSSTSKKVVLKSRAALILAKKQLPDRDEPDEDAEEHGEADYGVEEVKAKIWGEEVCKRYSKKMRNQTDKDMLVPRVCQAAKDEVKTDPYMEAEGEQTGVAEIQISSGEESVEYAPKMTNLGEKRNQRYMRDVKDSEAGKEVPHWRVKDEEGDQRAKGKGKR